MVPHLPYYSRSIQAGVCWKPSGWQNINIVWQRHQAEYFRSALCYQTDMQYWNTVARAELLQVATDYRNSIASLTKTIRERVEAGLVDPQDLLMAEVKLNEAEYQLLQAKSSLETGRMALNSLIGTALHEITEVEDTIPSIVMNEQLWKQDGSNRPN